jgi:hypothetical protein
MTGDEEKIVKRARGLGRNNEEQWRRDFLRLEKKGIRADNQVSENA